jgi:hypothetical protein
LNEKRWDYDITYDDRTRLNCAPGGKQERGPCRASTPPERQHVDRTVLIASASAIS